MLPGGRAPGPEIAPLVPLSLPGFGRDQLPVGIARGDVAREGPHVGDLGDAVGRALDDGARAVARDRNELRHETHRHLRGAAAQLGGDDLRLVDRHEARLDGLAALLALANGALEALITLARQNL